MSINQIKNSIKIILTLFGFKIMANNLIIATGDTIEMSGTHNYDIISITNGSILSVESQNGKLKLICDSLFLGQSSKIIADGISSDSLNSGEDFQSVAGGGAGGGYAGFGGNGGGLINSLGGGYYGTCFNFLKGSRGGSGQSVYNGAQPGGKGGGAIWIESRVSTLMGTISAKGSSGTQYDSFGSWPSGPDWGGSGGGSGGFIYLESKIINIDENCMITVKGGNGGTPLQGTDSDTTNPGGGGGGSGGRITILTDSNINQENFNVNGGSGGSSSDPDVYPGQDGGDGILNYIKTWVTSETHPDSTLFYLNNVPEFNLINLDDYIGYFFELNNIENDEVTLTSDYLPSDGEVTFFSPGTLTDGIYYFHVVPYDGGENILDSLALSRQIKIGSNSVHISSITHPESNTWYEGQNISITLDYPEGINDFYYEFDMSPFTIPNSNSSILAENDTWIMPGLEQGIYFVHVIAVDSLGFESNLPFRKRFNVGDTYPFNPFGQNNMVSDTLFFNYETINNPIEFTWNATSLDEGQWYYYGVDFYFDIDSVFEASLISGDSLNIRYSALEVYDYMSENLKDTLSGSWWVKTMNPYGDTLMSSNGPMAFTIIRDTSLTTYSQFEMNTPPRNTEIVIDQATLNDTILFSWDICDNIYGDTISYYIDYESSLESIISDTILTENSLSQSLVDTYLKMNDLEINSIEGAWMVTAINGLDTIQSNNEPFQISIEIGSGEIIPLAPFNLKYPLDSTHIHINAETLLDTLVIDWETSFNLYGIETNYEIDFEYNEEVENLNMLFQDTTLHESHLKVDLVSVFNMMKQAQVDSFSFSWQVRIFDDNNELFSLNGPFIMSLSREDIDIEKPLTSFNIGSNVLRYNTIIELFTTYIYNDTLSHFLDYSIDNGSEWITIFSLDTLSRKYNQIVHWNLFDDIGWNYKENLKIRYFSLGQNVSSDTLLIDSLIVANIAGDYIYEPDSEIGIQANDIAKLLSVFYMEGDSVKNYDIGPSSGLAPAITTEFDEKINFEDLSTFTQMWYWSNEYFSPITLLQQQNSGDTYDDLFVSTITFDDDSGFFNKLISYNSSELIMGLDMVLSYDANEISLESLSFKDILNSDDILKLHDHNEETGLVKLSLWSKNNNSVSFKGDWFEIKYRKKLKRFINSEIKIFVEPIASPSSSQLVKKQIFSVNLPNQLPKIFFLAQNYPNPFNPSTIIRYSLKDEAFVSLTVYDMKGRLIKTLVNNFENPGEKEIEWNGKNDFGAPLSSGMYFYKLKQGNDTQMKKMILLK